MADVSQPGFSQVGIAQILESFPFWKNLTQEERALVSQRMVTRKFAKNQLVVSKSAVCLGIIFLLSGKIRISLISDEGREITLYRAATGEFCVSTATCVVSQLTFDAEVTAEEDTQVLVIPSPVIDKLMNTNIYVRAFVFEQETERYSQTVWAIQHMLFRKLDQRLAGYLVDAFKKTAENRGSAADRGFTADIRGSTAVIKSVAPQEIKRTQEEIARDINSAREVVARMLRDFSAKGFVEIKRGSIIVKNIDALKKLG